MISVENLSKRFGEHVLFETVAFQLNPRERLGLVGRNGHGKTTLFRIINGEEEPDEGFINIPKSYRIVHVRQAIDFSRETVLKEAAAGLPAHEGDQIWRAEKILAGLGFSENDMERHPEEFSGGYQVRLNLAKALVAEPDLILLDEPTNYLDITSIRWVERFFLTWPRELMLITHDRSFMDSVVTHTMGIHRQKLRKISGGTDKYYTQIAQDEEVHEKTRLNDERRRKDIELFITRFRAKARLANMVQSRIKTLQKMEKHEKLEKIKTLGFSFRSRPFPGRQMVTAQKLSFAYHSPNPLIRDFSITIAKNDRICIVGRNGRGKTTLLRLLAGSLRPQAGSIGYNPNVMVGSFEQTNLKTLVDARTIEEEILYANPDITRQSARNICGAMMFEGDDALKKIGVLSGGEKSRVMLGKLLATPFNLLLLDEPTNHLDMESCDALLAALDNFEGAVVMVTHNEMFLHALARRLVVFQSEGIEIFDGSYQGFLEKGGWQEEAPADPASDGGASAEQKTEKVNKKELRRRRSELLAERARILRPIEREAIRVENEIDANEKRLDALTKDMQSASQTGDGTRIAELSQAIHACRTAIDRLFEDLERQSEVLDEQKRAFDEKMDTIEAQ
ncbi:MAG: ABC-F family ATP-binding cassette domain-containing protein [Desulfobacterales bacterium]